MTEPARSDDPMERRDGAASGGTPRWVKILAVVGGVVVLAVVILLLVGGHGPGRHTGSGPAGEHQGPSSVSEDHAPPAGGHG